MLQLILEGVKTVELHLFTGTDTFSSLLQSSIMAMQIYRKDRADIMSDIHFIRSMISCTLNNYLQNIRWWSIRSGTVTLHLNSRIRHIHKHVAIFNYDSAKLRVETVGSQSDTASQISILWQTLPVVFLLITHWEWNKCHHIPSQSLIHSWISSSELLLFHRT